MNRRPFFISFLAVLGGLLATAPFSAGPLLTPMLAASEPARATASQLSGSYQVVGKTSLGSQTRVRLKLRLANGGKTDLAIERMTLWRSAHPAQSAVIASRLLLRMGATQNTTQEFLVPTTDYRSWMRRAPLTLLVSVEDPNGRKTTELVRLSRISGRKVN